MRLKTMEVRPLAVRNGNGDTLNSPKRINTVQNSNCNDKNTTTTTTTTADTPGTEYVTNTTDYGNSIDNSTNFNTDTVQWCNPSQETLKLYTNNNNNNNNNNYYYNNRNRHNSQLLNINNTLAATLRRRTASSVHSESSSDDSFVENEEALHAQPSCSSAETSPQVEERPFDISDSDSSEDDNFGNQQYTRDFDRLANQQLSQIGGQQGCRGIVNPNYPGFQHLAHTLDFNSDGDDGGDDDDYEDETSLQTETIIIINNNNNNSNNNNENYNNKIDSINRLDSVENIQKVFYDKELGNIKCKEIEKDLSNTLITSINDCDGELITQKCEELVNHFDIDGLGRQLVDLSNAKIVELKETVESLEIIKDTQSTMTKYNIESPPDEIIQPTLTKYNIQPNELATLPQVDTQPTFRVLNDSKIITFNTLDMLNVKIEDAFLSNAKEEVSICDAIFTTDNCKEDNIIDKQSFFSKDKCVSTTKEENSSIHYEKDNDSVMFVTVTSPHKKEREDVEIPTVRKRRDYNRQFGSWITVPRRDLTNRRSASLVKEEKKKNNCELLGSFDVYNIETAMPKIDLEAIENHLKAAREEERRRRTDREEIRRRLAMGNEDDYYTDRPGRKPSLQSRLQSGMNLQICFMNESLSDTDSPSSDSECPMTNPKQTRRPDKSDLVCNGSAMKAGIATRPATLSINQSAQVGVSQIGQGQVESDFFARQARLQTEARMALAQAKEMARMQMEIEKQRQKKSPITEMIRNSLEKVGIPFPEEKRRLSRQILTEMNVAQLQVIVNDLHTRIETLNESLVKFLMDRDDLHMEQDSMLVDIEDLTRYLGAKEQVMKEKKLNSANNNNNINASPPSPAPSSPLSTLNNTVKPHLHRIANLVKK